MDADISARIPTGLRILAMFLRLVFMGALVAIAIRVSLPQSETFWSVHETPGDLVRLALGIAVCLWVAIHLFTLPKTIEAYKRWINLGLVIAPVALALAVVMWR
jgi:TRAP-type C4-dicarboxylate transport system permease small subunit